MRWVFYSLVVLNVLYFGAKIGTSILEPDPQTSLLMEYQNEQAKGGKLMLLKERPYDVPLPESIEDDKPAEPKICHSIGPFSTLKEGQLVVNELRKAGYSAVVREVAVQQEPINWVFLPPYESKEVALQKLRELQERDVDSYLVTEGDQVNAISLGYFSKYESAVGLQERLRAAGYPAELEQKQREAKEIWVSIVPESIKDEGVAMEALVGQQENLRIERSACLQ